MTHQGADELRIRAFLRAHHVRPFGHQEPAMPEPDRRPITPTQIIPAGAPLPARAPEPGEAPPWRTPPPPPPVPPGPDPGPIEVRHTHDIILTWAEPDPEPDPPLWSRAWDWVWDRLVTWRMLLAIVAAVTPWLGGQSPVGAWSHTVHQARTDAGILAAYIIAGVALATAWVLDRRTGRVIPRCLLVTAALGSLGVLHWWDPFLLLTGVHR